MNDKRLEQLSALMDSELSEREARLIIHGTGQDKALSDIWMRYHLIGEALRQDLPKTINRNFAEKMSRVLENEPHILVSKRRLPSNGWRRPLSALAMAASIAGIAVLGWKTNLQLPSAQTPSPAALSPASQAAIQPLPVATVRWSDRQTKTSPRLDRYLMNHQQFKSSTEMDGVSPYVRIVGYETSP
jgi:sigma-E factor negative regulatory protein RseA